MPENNYYEKKEKDILRALSHGLSRTAIYPQFGYSSLRAMNTFMRRRGYYVTKNGYEKKQELIPQNPNAPSYEQYPEKARNIALYFQNHSLVDPVLLAKTLGFENHMEMNQYMKHCGLRYHSRTGSYYPADEFTPSYTGLPDTSTDTPSLSNLRNKRCTFYLSQCTLQQLENYAKEKQLSNSEVIELALQDFLDISKIIQNNP